MARDKTPKIEAATVLTRSGDILDAEIEGEAVMMSVEKGEYYGLDKIGTEIWEMLAEPRSLAQLCAALLERYDVGPEECERDVAAFLETLLSDGSVNVVEPVP